MSKIVFPEPKQMPSRDTNQLYPICKKKADDFVAECAKAGIPVLITQTYRTGKYQHSLYLIGRTKETKNKKIVTNCDDGDSPHQMRVAWDICINIKGKAYDIGLLKKCGKIAQKMGIQWGGDWNGNGKQDKGEFIDYPHFQYNGEWTYKQIMQGKIPTK